MQMNNVLLWKLTFVRPYRRFSGTYIKLFLYFFSQILTMPVGCFPSFRRKLKKIKKGAPLLKKEDANKDGDATETNKNAENQLNDGCKLAPQSTGASDKEAKEPKADVGETKEDINFKQCTGQEAEKQLSKKNEKIMESNETQPRVNGYQENDSMRLVPQPNNLPCSGHVSEMEAERGVKHERDESLLNQGCAPNDSEGSQVDLHSSHVPLAPAASPKIDVMRGEEEHHEPPPPQQDAPCDAGTAEEEHMAGEHEDHHEDIVPADVSLGECAAPEVQMVSSEEEHHEPPPPPPQQDAPCDVGTAEEEHMAGEHEDHHEDVVPADVSLSECAAPEVQMVSCEEEHHEPPPPPPQPDAPCDVGTAEEDHMAGEHEDHHEDIVPADVSLGECAAPEVQMVSSEEEHHEPPPPPPQPDAPCDVGTAEEDHMAGEHEDHHEDIVP
uniref:Bromo domain-containing protein n=1 Tax=Mesocestoides corti TaxID=53468 RepID=A0A5K3FTB5_MESCO